MKDCFDCEYKSQLFDHLSPDELELVNNNRQYINFEKGETLVNMGDSVNEFIYLIKGLAKLIKINRNGKEQIVSIARPMDFVGLLDLFSEPEYTYTLSAITEVKACKIDLKVMRQLAQKNGQFSMQILKYISLISGDIIKKTYLLNSKNLRGRIATVLLDFSDNIYQDDSFELPISRKEIAEMIDMTPENVIRILSEFKRDDLIEVKGKFIRIINKKMVRKIMDLG